MIASFNDKLAAAAAASGSLLCLGLDPDPAAFPDHFPAGDPASGLAAWGRRLIEQTADLVCCYKPNLAFYEQFGAVGFDALRQTLAVAPRDIPVLLDAKRGDIGSTAAAYARMAFEVVGADAVTVNPYLGRDSMAPFLAYAGKAVFVLCYTSNPSAAEIQELMVNGEGALFEHLARQAMTWGAPEQIGLVVGATRPAALARVRRALTGRPCWILAPGVGAQGGDLQAALTAGLDARGSGLLVPVSRHILYADDPRAAALSLHSAINHARAAHAAGERVDTDAEASRSLVLALHEAGCVQFGAFTLASGLQSPIYLDLRRIASDPGLLRQAAAAYAARLAPLSCQRLAAVPYAALPLATAAALAVHKPLIYPRKEIKTHGTRQAIEGAFAAGERVAVIEDLVTSGGSVLTAVETLRSAGLLVSDVVALIDREQGARAALAAAGCTLHTALTLRQVVETLHAAARISADQAHAVQAMLQN